jgi:hypothetical protein
MFLPISLGKPKKKVGTNALDVAFLKHRPPGPPRIPLVHWPAPLDGLLSPSFFISNALAQKEKPGC